MSRATVLIPNYNNEPFIREALESVLNQSFSDFDVLIVDDCSSDNGLDVVAEINDPRVRILKKDKNSGIVDALNLGLDQITTEYAIRMDGDDISTPDRFEKLICYMDENPDCGVCSSYLKSFGKEDKVTQIASEHKNLLSYLLFNSSVPHAPSVFRMSILNEHQIRYRSIHPYMEDYDLFFRLKDKTRLHVLPEVLYHYRILDHNSTVQNMHTFYDRYKSFYHQVLEELKIEPTADRIEMHLQLAKSIPPTYTPKEFFAYKSELKHAVQSTNIYPVSETENLIDRKYNSLFYRYADKSFGAGFSFLRANGFDSGKLKYLIKTSLKSKSTK